MGDEMSAIPSLVTLTGGRGHLVYKSSTGSGRGVVTWYEVSDRDKDAALVHAYTEAMGRAPHNRPETSEQFTHSPHKRNRRQVMESAKA